jgi:hypothetical protein
MQVDTQPAQTVRGWKSYFDGGIYFFFAVFVILLPYSTKGARYAWIAAFYLWMAEVVFLRRRIFEQPLALPLLAYVGFSGISTFLSPDPYLSWPHMKLVCWAVLIGAVFAQNLQRLSKVRTLLLLLLLSATSVAGFTAWQYLHGIGLQVVWVERQAPLHQAGIRPGDILTSANGHSLRSRQDVMKAIHGVPGDATVELRYLRGLPLRRYSTLIRGDLLAAGVAETSGATFRLGRPVRAQGTLRHHGILAEVLMPIGCLAWALMLGSGGRRIVQIGFAGIFCAIMATIFLTQTRAALSGLFAGCLVASLVMASRWTKISLISVLLVLATLAGFWVQHTRKLKWVDASDPGTHYRLLMWQDGLRLAREHPLFGVGMETIQNHWTEWKIRGYEQYREFWNFHSDYVQLAAERGFLTLAAWLWFIAAYLCYLWRLQRRMRRETHFGWAVVSGILAGFVAFLFTSLVESSLGDDSLVMLLFFCYGTAVAMERMLQEPAALDVAESLRRK